MYTGHRHNVYSIDFNDELMLAAGKEGRLSVFARQPTPLPHPDQSNQSAQLDNTTPMLGSARPHSRWIAEVCNAAPLNRDDW